MLSAEHRLRAQADFRDVVRRGRRAGRPLLVLHLLVPRPPRSGAAGSDTPDAGSPGDAPPGPGSAVPARAGLVVSRTVGNAVVRHRVSRRLRHLLRDRLLLLPDGARLVVRAASAAGAADSAALAHDLDAGLDRLGLRPDPGLPR